MKRIYLISCTLLCIIQVSVGQVRGLVTDTNGEPLPFASIYVQGTTTGTTSNIKGEYAIDLEKGMHSLVFQYIGYRQKIENLTLGAQALRLNVELEPEAINLAEIQIRADAEDPAYAIIRKTIAKRKYYRQQLKTWACDVYIKGNIKLLDTPKKILGQEVGDMGGSLDTNRQGIMYLSESVSKLYFLQPHKYKEVMISSKVSGNDNGFSYNSAQDMHLELYENYIELGRNIISPIADGAFGYYRYRLQGVIVDEEGRFINKIEVIPRRSADPVFGGFIYIVDKLWNLQSVDLFLTGINMQQPIMDTFRVRQVFLPVAKPDVWRKFSQTYSFSGGVLGFKFGGSFTGIFSNYNLSPGLKSDFFDNEVMKVEKGANEKDTAYWNETRPVPLTIEEEVDYQRKDSIQVVRASKSYLDSLDKKNNKLGLNDLIFGYTRRNSWNGTAFTVESPLLTFQFNTVQGYNFSPDISFRKEFDKDNIRWLNLSTNLSYGFAEDKLRVQGQATYNFNRTTNARISLTAGREVVQFNSTDPISLTLNTIYSQFSRRNYIRIYDHSGFRLNYQQELVNGVFMRGFVSWAKRLPLSNNSDYSLFYRDTRIFDENVPGDPPIEPLLLQPSRAAVYGLSLRFRIAQQYMNYPDHKYNLGSDFPDIWLHYQRGVAFGENGENALRSDVDYHRIALTLIKTDIKLGLMGTGSLHFEAGKFFDAKNLYFYDFKHFEGNETHLANPSRYLTTFKMLPYYSHSTRSGWVEAHWEHNFKGFITDKIPFIKKKGWNLMASAGFLYTTENKEYLEIALGIDGIGFGFFKLLRLDVVSSFDRNGYAGTGLLIGLNLPGGNIRI